MVGCISQQSWVLKSDCENCWPNSSYYITEITSQKSTKVSCYIYIVKSLYTTGLISSFRLYIKRFISFLLMSFDKWEVSARFIKAFFAAHTRYQSIRNIYELYLSFFPLIKPTCHLISLLSFYDQENFSQNPCLIKNPCYSLQIHQSFLWLNAVVKQRLCLLGIIKTRHYKQNYFVKSWQIKHETGIPELENRVKKPNYGLWRHKTELSQIVTS